MKKLTTKQPVATKVRDLSATDLANVVGGQKPKNFNPQPDPPG